MTVSPFVGDDLALGVGEGGAPGRGGPGVGALLIPDPPVGEGEDALIPLPRHTESWLSVNNLGADLKAVKSFKNGE